MRQKGAGREKSAALGPRACARRDLNHGSLDFVGGALHFVTAAHTYARANGSGTHPATSVLAVAAMHWNLTLPLDAPTESGSRKRKEDPPEGRVSSISPTARCSAPRSSGGVRRPRARRCV